MWVKCEGNVEKEQTDEMGGVEARGKVNDGRERNEKSKWERRGVNVDSRNWMDERAKMKWEMEKEKERKGEGEGGK